MKTKSRGNGQGTAYKRGSTWEAQVIVGWVKNKKNPTGPLVPVKRRKSGFKRKQDAINYCPTLLRQSAEKKRRTLEQVYDAWSDLYAHRVGDSTMVNYFSAYNHFRPLHGLWMDEITPDDLQRCMDDCPAGHRTHQNMKCVAGLLWGYACDQNIVQRDITENLFIGRGASVQRDPITRSEVSAIRSRIGSSRYAEYIYCLCYLGFRPGEMLELRKDMLHCSVLPADDDHPEDRTVYYFINGKTGRLQYYDKHHLFTYGGENHYYQAGESHTIVEYGGFRILLLTCYDLRFPVWSRYSDDLQFDMIVCVANWPESRQNAFHILTRARAIENMAYLIAVNRVGDDSHNHYRGCSCIVSPIGRTLVCCPPQIPSVASFSLNLESLQQKRKKFKVLDDRD